MITRLRKRLAAFAFLRAAHARVLATYFSLKRRIWRARQERLPYDYLRDYLRENRITFDAIPDAELYYLHSYRQFPAVRRRARLTGAPVVYDAHDSYREMTPVPIPGVTTALHLVERRCAREAVARTTTTDAMAARLQRRFKRPFEVIRNCQDQRLADESDSDIRTDAGVPEDELLIVMVANRKPGIPFEAALSAIESVGDGVHLAFLGARYEEEQALTGERGMEARVHFLPPVAPTAVADYVHSADAAAVLYSPLRESYVEIFLPNGLFYAVAAGLPLVYSRFGEIGATGDRYRLGIPVDPDDPASVAGALDRLRTDRGLLSSLRESVRRAQPELSWEHDERLVARLVDTALAGKPR